MLSSRPQASQVEDVRQSIDASGAVISVVDDMVTDPPCFSVHLEHKGKVTPLLIRGASQQVSVFDLMGILDKLGFAVDYQEIR